MNEFDLVILAIILLFTGLGIYWGLIRQVLAIVGFLVGVILAGQYGGDVAGWISSFDVNEALAGALGFILVLLFVSSVASLIASLLRFFVGLLFLGWVDHLLGGVLGLVQALLASAALIIITMAFPLPAWNQSIATSQLTPPLLPLSAALTALLPEMFRVAIPL